MTTVQGQQCKYKDALALDIVELILYCHFLFSLSIQYEIYLSCTVFESFLAMDSTIVMLNFNDAEFDFTFFLLFFLIEYPNHCP